MTFCLLIGQRFIACSLTFRNVKEYDFEVLIYTYGLYQGIISIQRITNSCTAMWKVVVANDITNYEPGSSTSPRRHGIADI